ncbi:thiamine-phosphate kinase [Microbacterium elymi]|uniref:Thiamine-monophosphate kinase n=1 Tax=Microbacterium elymi TaxID=2909587 RepID=A0ABY5NJV2_9MICO|nr:thiamine-phosphate kinase [Microbacterium elymi]UUT35452.1 thiamine-phosphate kinase [Microbacterium elymi]
MTEPKADPMVGELSEAAVLGAILARIGPSAALVGPGDDAAVLEAPDGRIVATVDTLVHGPDFRLAWSTGFDLGWKAAAVNLADVAAMGARPTALLVALALPEATRLSFVTALADGLRAACAALAPGCAVEGGDLTVSDTLTVAVTALGALDGARPVRRSGARPGDALALAGEAGLAADGLRILFDRFRDADGRPVAVDRGALRPEQRRAVDAQLRPSPPILLGPAAARAGATAMMDVSDGLVLDATRLADASQVTVDLDPTALGPDPDAALAGGEDHALLAAFPATMPLPEGFRRIGRIADRGPGAVTVAGAPYAGRGGWDPYRDWDAAGG